MVCVGPRALMNHIFLIYVNLAKKTFVIILSCNQPCLFDFNEFHRILILMGFVRADV